MRIHEPTVAPELPECPAWVGDEAREHWDRIAPMLANLGVMGAPHAVALSLLVDALADFIRFADLARIADAVVCGSTGNDVANPIFRLKAVAWDRVLKACREFGMTPAAITGVQGNGADKDKPKNVADRFRLAQ
jgi:P27 family predicted phage terminase small subunit